MVLKRKVPLKTVRKYIKDAPRMKSAAADVPLPGGGGETFRLEYRRTMTIEEKTACIKRVVDGCFDSDGVFHPEYVDPILYTSILQICTNLPVLTLQDVTASDGEPAVDLDAMYDLYMCLVHDLAEISDGEDTLYGIEYELRDLINPAIRERLKRTPLQASLTGAVNAVRDGVAALTDMLKDVDVESLTKYAGVLTKLSQGVTENSLADGIFRAYREEQEHGA